LLCDLRGEWFGSPALAMSRLPGAPELRPSDVDAWVDALARTLAAMHDQAPTTAPASLDRPAIWDRWTREGLPSGERTDAIEGTIVDLRATAWERRFCHCDLHAGNVLFASSEVSGVVDWSSGRVAPVLHDVGRMRMELSLWPGGDATARFTATYTSESGRSVDGVAPWDVLAGAVALANRDRWLRLFGPLGVPVSAGQLRKRATAFVDDALRCLTA
jgi:aminoglycoside phosphotransferase (APT) family kinase protein